MWKNNNILLHGIQIKQAGKNVAPVIYLNDLFKQGAYVEDAVQWVLNVFYNSQVDDIDTTELMKFDNIKSRIRCKLINYDLNREYLQNKVFVRFLDLAVVFTIEMYLNMDDVENAVIVITKSLFGFWDINESQLFDVAKENTLKYIRNVNSFLYLVYILFKSIIMFRRLYLINTNTFKFFYPLSFRI